MRGRAVRVAQAGHAAGVVPVPLVGRIAAGAPILAQRAVQDVLSVPVALVGHGDLFALKIVSQSMIDVGNLTVTSSPSGAGAAPSPATSWRLSPVTTRRRRASHEVM
ncbi:LexA family protein [Streptomyces sp. YS-3]|uniref:LexA family protein n=1 Tax=Streptomyces sp. YS-3 TaxID=3381352 RepID=UPI003862AA30